MKNKKSLFVIGFFLGLNFYTILGHQKITILGTGYVGLVTGACLSDLGNLVTCADIDSKKIEKLQELFIPIYEPGLEVIVKRNAKNGQLSFTTNIDQALKASDVIIVAIATPMDSLGNPNLTALNAGIASIAQNLTQGSTSHKFIVIKSTVPLGTCAKIRTTLENNYGIDPSRFDIISWPEFLREGCAVNDFFNPDREVLGVESDSALSIMSDILSVFRNQKIPLVVTNVNVSELIKYVSNGFLSVKISFINEIANLCDVVGIDVRTVAEAIGLDKRIGKEFLKSGPGYGGSCFPKDTMALFLSAQDNGIRLRVVDAAIKTNNLQKAKPFLKLSKLLEGNFLNKTIALLGLSFKPNTDDVRGSPSIRTIELLLEHGATIKAYDPVAMESMKHYFPNLNYCESLYQAVENVDAIVVMTDWEEFKNANIEQIADLVGQKIIVDAHGTLDPQQLKKYGFKAESIGSAVCYRS